MVGKYDVKYSASHYCLYLYIYITIHPSKIYDSFVLYDMIFATAYIVPIDALN